MLHEMQGILHRNIPPQLGTLPKHHTDIQCILHPVFSRYDSIYGNTAPVRLQDSCQHLYRGRFSGSVGIDKADDLSFLNPDIYVGQNARRNPYVKKEKQQITIDIDCDVIDYFKVQSSTSGIPYQTLINLYLSDCVTKKRELQMTWE